MKKFKLYKKLKAKLNSTRVEFIFNINLLNNIGKYDKFKDKLKNSNLRLKGSTSMSDAVNMTGIPETMLQTLYARAKETESGRNIINDPIAVKIVSELDYDFSFAEADKTMSSGVIARTILLDKMCGKYLSEHPDTSVINIACGLDTRCYRMEGKFRDWYNLDLPETMAIRKSFLKETDKIHQLAFSAMDELWTGEIKDKEGNFLIIIEGLSMYLSRQDVKQIFKLIDENFKTATVYFEVMNPFVVSHVKEKSIEGSRAKFSWGIRNGRDFEVLVPPFKNAEDRSLVEGMQVFMPVYKILGKIPFIRNISNKILVMEK